MLENIEKINKLIQESKETGQDNSISEEEYTLFLKEKETISALFTTLHQQREVGATKVTFKNLISEQIEEIFVPQKGLNQEAINLRRKQIQSGYNWGNTNDEDDENDGNNKVKKHINKYSRILNNGRRFPRRLDAFLIKPAGIAATYEIQNDCYAAEIFNSLWYKNQEEANENLRNTTMNLLQIDSLYKDHTLKFAQYYAMFCIIHQKIIIINFFSHENKTFKRWPWKIEKGTKLLLFTPENTL